MEASDSQNSTDLKELNLKVDEYMARIFEVEASKMDVIGDPRLKPYRERYLKEAADLRLDIAKKKEKERV